MARELRILIGTSDIAGLINQYALGFRKAGCKVTTTSIYPFANLFAHNYDVKLYELGSLFFKKKGGLSPKLAAGLNVLFNRIPFLKRKVIEKYLINEHDVFIYIWGKSSLFPHKSDMPLIRSRNKKIIHFFLGSDARVAEAFKQEFPLELKSYYDTQTTLEDFQEKISQIRTIEKYANIIYSIPDQAGLQIRPYNHLVLPFDFQPVEFRTKNNPKVVVIHCPSNQAIKGSDFIIETVEKLKREIDFEFRLVSGVSNKDILQHLQESDILIDELVLHGPGMLSLEAMSSGCVALTKFTHKNVERFKPPVVKVDEHNLYAKLKKVILNAALRRRIARAGRTWVEQNHSAQQIASKILADLEKTPHLKYDYYPQFYKEFTLPDYLQYNQENIRLTQEVIRLTETDIPH